MQAVVAPPVQLQAQLIEDLRTALLARLQSAGYVVPAALQSDPSSVVECYFTTLRRQLDERPRRVHVARQLYVPAVVSDTFARNGAVASWAALPTHGVSFPVLAQDPSPTATRPLLKVCL